MTNIRRQIEDFKPEEQSRRAMEAPNRAFASSFIGQLFHQHPRRINRVLPPTEEVPDRARPQSSASDLTRSQHS